MAPDEINENLIFAIPYAGITQVRFKGYLLSQKFGTPCAERFFIYSKYPLKSSSIPAKGYSKNTPKIA